jgi:hypothetical protein
MVRFIEAFWRYPKLVLAVLSLVNIVLFFDRGAIAVSAPTFIANSKVCSSQSTIELESVENHGGCHSKRICNWFHDSITCMGQFSQQIPC